MLKGFKDFILRGNVIDLAVAVVIGGAFTAIVTAVVDAIITPMVSLFMRANATGKVGVTVTNIYGDEVIFPIGTLITAVISFLAVAAVVYFAFVLPMNKFKELQERRAGVDATEEAAPLPTEQELLIQIRDLLEENKSLRGGTAS